MAAPIEPGSATRLLNRLGAGDSEAAHELAPLVYSELHDLASALLVRNATLQPTALVHEAWIRFAGEAANFENRYRFYALASKIMRSVLIDHARARQAQKRGPGQRPVTWVDAGEATQDRRLDLMELDEALQRLESLDGELSTIVELLSDTTLKRPSTIWLTGAYHDGGTIAAPQGIAIGAMQRNAVTHRPGISASTRM